MRAQSPTDISAGVWRDLIIFNSTLFIHLPNIRGVSITHPQFLGCMDERPYFLKSKTKESPSSGRRGGKFIFVNNFSAQEHMLRLKTGTF